MFINTASIANCNALSLGREIEELYAGGVRYLHIDLIDGHYVPNLGYPLTHIRDIKGAYPDIKMDVHMMVDNPLDYLDRLQENGADLVAFHVDSTKFVRRALKGIRDRGMKAGVVLNPSQRIDLLEPYLYLLDHVILMTVEPGFAGQPLLEDSMERIRELVELRKKRDASFLISVDGGMNTQNCIDAAKMGVEMFVTTVHTVFKQPDGLTAACLRFQKALEEALAE